MSDGHVRRTRLDNGRRTKKAGIATRRGRGRPLWLWLALFTLPVAVIIPAVWYVAFGPHRDDMVKAIREYGFEPLIPPNQLRGPGALYLVEGNSLRKVCDVDPPLLTGKLQKSPTLDHVRRRLEKGKFSLGGGYVDELNAKLDGARVTTIEYRMRDVAISEIAMDDLLEIQDNLLRQKSCDDVVQRLLKANKQVCPGYAALSATTSYKVHYDVKVDTSAQTKMATMALVQRVIEADSGGQIQIQSADELFGENLFYGIQLSKFCITPDTATQPSVRPELPSEGNSQSGSVFD
jgi:hypothetical protein